MSFARRVAVTIGANGVLGVLGFISGTMAARLLGPTGRGELAAIQTWAGFLAVVATLGLPEAVVLFCSREPLRGGRYITSAILGGVIGCIPMLLLGNIALPFLLSAQVPKVVYAARWYLTIAIIYVALGAPYGALRSLPNLTRWNAIRLIPAILWVAVLCFAFFTGNARPEFLALLNLVAVAAIALPITLWVARRTIKGSYLPDPHSLIPMLRFGIPSVASGVPQTLNLRFDQMLIAGLLPARLLGLYVVAVAWSSVLSPLSQGIAAVLFPHIAAYGSRDDQSRAFVRIVRFASPLACVLAVAVALATPWILPRIFGLPYRESVPSAVILVVASAVLGINQLLEEGFRGLNKPICILWSELAGLIVTATTLIVLLRRIGIVGAALSSLLGYTSVCILLLTLARSETGYSIREMLLPSSSEIFEQWAKVSQQLGRQK